jgi:hypothetical protein
MYLMCPAWMGSNPPDTITVVYASLIIISFTCLGVVFQVGHAL